MNENRKDLNLLPTIFKKVALGILLLTVLFMVLALSKNLSIEGEIAKTISKTGFLISLLIFALTKNKIEDELTFKIRLSAFAGSFIVGVLYIIVEPFVNLLFGDSFMSDKGATGLLINMFLFYFLIFYSRLKKR